MKAFIEHESRGRLRVRMKQYRMTLEQADLLEAYLQNQPGVLNATVHERTCCAVIRYIGDRENIIRAIAQFNYTAPSVTALTPTHSGRALNREYQEKLVGKVITKFACTLFLPAPLQIARTIWLSLPFLGRGLKRLIHRELKVELLDALSIGVSWYAGTSPRQVRLCSCWILASCSRSGRIKSRLTIWHAACRST